MPQQMNIPSAFSRNNVMGENGRYRARTPEIERPVPDKRSPMTALKTAVREALAPRYTTWKMKNFK
jgi:hypothetical protein